MRGLVLTSGNAIALELRLLRGGFDTLKIVTEWGVEKTAEARGRALAMMPNVILRTKTGDPSAGGDSPKDEHLYPLLRQAIEELDPWIRIKSRLLIEIGNEPNVHRLFPKDWQDYCYKYRWFLDETLTGLRKRYSTFPVELQPKYISPALSLHPSNRKRAEQFLSINHDVLKKFEYIGWHVYGVAEGDMWEQFTYASTLANRLFPRHKHIITEINMDRGIENSELRKALQVQLARLDYPWVGATLYHVGDAMDIDPHQAVTLAQVEGLIQ